MRQLWRSGDPAVRQILGPLATPYPRGDGLPVVSIVLRPESPQAEDQPPNVIGDPGVVVLLEEMRRRVELLATALPADVGGRRPSVVFAQLEQWLEGIYSEITGQPARFSGRAGARAGRFFRFVKAVVAWLSDAASDLSGVKFDLPATEDALRMALHRLVQANTTPVFQVTGFVQKSIASAIPGSSAGFILDYTNRYPKCLRVAKCKCY